MRRFLKTALLILLAADAAVLGVAIFRFTPMVLGPDDLPRVHGVDERLSVEVYGRTLRFYARLIEQLETL